MFFKNNFLKSGYLSNCDFLNKYNIVNIHEIPKLSKIHLNFSLDAFFTFSNSSGFSEKDCDTQIKAYLLFFFFFRKKTFY